MIRNRTTKSVAKRHDLDYFKRGSAVRLWQWRLSIVALITAVVWLGVSGMRHGDGMFSAGPISSSHAAFGARCVACHEPLIASAGWSPVAAWRRPVKDAACLSCHVAPAHHAESAAFTPSCGSCHVEHAGSMHLAATADRSCTQCHATLPIRDGTVDKVSGIRSFVDGHPEFRPLQQVSQGEREAAFSLKFNHAAHMKPALSGPAGSVTLKCSDCHRTPAESATIAWRFQGRAESESRPASDATGRSQIAPQARGSEEIHSAAAYMAPATYQQTCRACHTLEFDSHIQAEAPHAAPSTVQRFVVEQITAYAASHPAVVAEEIRSGRVADEVAGQVPMAPPRSTQQWIETRVARADRILWQGKCSLCHVVSSDGQASRFASDPGPSGGVRLISTSFETGVPSSASSLRVGADEASNSRAGLTLMQIGSLPTVAPSMQPKRWYGAAVFRHDAHQEVKCAECHAEALTSTSGKDLLMPSVSVCQRCHDGTSRPQGPPVANGKAESGCFLCHSYHGWTGAGESVLGHPHQALSIDELTAGR